MTPLLHIDCRTNEVHRWQARRPGARVLKTHEAMIDKETTAKGLEFFRQDGLVNDDEPRVPEAA